MKKLLAFALSLAVLSPAYAQNDKPKEKKKDEKKNTLTIGFNLLEGFSIKLETKKDEKKYKPKKMIQVNHTKVGFQTLPSTFYLQDEVQYYPPSTETPLPNTRRAQQEYRLNQNAKPNTLMKLNHIRVPAPKSSPIASKSVFQSSESLRIIWFDVWIEDSIAEGSKVPIGIESKHPKKDEKFGTRTGNVLGAIIGTFSDAAKPKKMVQKKKNVEMHRLTKMNFIRVPVPMPVVEKQDDIIKLIKGYSGPHHIHGSEEEVLGPLFSTRVPQVIKPAMATAAAKTAPACPDCPTVAKNPILQAGFVKAPPAGVIMIQTKITETDKNGKKNILAAPRVTTIPGQKATVQIMSVKDDGIKLDIVALPSKLHPGHLMVSPVFHKMSKNGTTICKFQVLTKSGVPATIKVGSELHKNIELEIIAHHIFPNRLPPMPRVIKTGFTTSAKKSVMVCPHCKKAIKPQTQKFQFFKKTKEGAFLIRTKTIESNQTDNNFEIDISLDQKTANGRIEKAGFVKTVPDVIMIQTKITETDKTGKKNVLATPKMMTRPGQKATMQIANEKAGIKLEIVAKPVPFHPGHIIITPVLHKMDKHGQMKVIATPTIMTKNGVPAKVMIGTKNHSNIEMEIMAGHLIVHPQPHKVMLRMNSPKFVFGGMTHKAQVPYMSRLPLLKEMFTRHTTTMPHHAIAMPSSIYTASGTMPVLTNKLMCKDCQMATMANCSCCGKPMAAKAMISNIMQAGFAEVSDKTMTVKVYPFLRELGLRELGLRELGSSEILELFFDSDTEEAKVGKSVIASLIETIQTSVSPVSWKKNGGKASISFSWYGCCFVVRQNQQGHEELSKLLSQLTQSMKETIKAMEEKE